MIMPNWCSTAYAIEGDAKEIKSLDEFLKKEKGNLPEKTLNTKLIIRDSVAKITHEKPL